MKLHKVCLTLFCLVIFVVTTAVIVLHKPKEVGAPDIVMPHAVTQSDTVIQTANAVLTALKNVDYITLENLTSLNGLSLNLYPRLDLTKIVVAKLAVSDIPTDKTIHLFGYTDGKGDPINLTTADFIKKYIYTADYIHAPDIAVGKVLGTGNSTNTILADAGDRVVVAYHFDGFNPQYTGMDWTTLYLVFENENGSYKLRGIAKDNWTI